MPAVSSPRRRRPSSRPPVPRPFRSPSRRSIPNIRRSTQPIPSGQVSRARRDAGRGPQRLRAQGGRLPLEPSRPARSSSIRRPITSTISRPTAWRCATASASASRGSPGRARRSSRPSRNGRIGIRPKRWSRRHPELKPQLDKLQSGQGVAGGLRNPLGARAMYLWQGNKGHVVSYPRDARAAFHRHQRVLRLHPDDQPGCHRPLLACQRRHEGRRALTVTIAGR